jgi:ParB family transcriptional regulator, chromosome partitioning protein
MKGRIIMTAGTVVEPQTDPRSMRNIIAANPFRTRMWSLHDRSDEHVTEESCKAEIESFEKHGQLVPALGRRLRGDPDYEVELIYGARRLFVARHLNKPLLVDLREISDREAIVAMDIENRQRTDVSPYERGVSYAHWLRRGHFRSQDDIARALKISASQVSRLLRLAKLPSVILNAFATPLEICETWGLDIMDALEDAERRPRTIQAARAISELNPRLPAKQVYLRLITAASRGRQPKQAARVEIVRDRAGAPLYRIRRLSTSVSLVLPSEKLSAASMAEIRTVLAGILQRGSPEFSVRAASRVELAAQVRA